MCLGVCFYALCSRVLGDIFLAAKFGGKEGSCTKNIRNNFSMLNHIYGTTL
jgi:hypothetical protein